jgi:hypothetical protein
MRTVAGSVRSLVCKDRRVNRDLAANRVKLDLVVSKVNEAIGDLLGIADLKATVASGGLLVIKEIEDPKVSLAYEGQRAPRVNQESKVNGDQLARKVIKGFRVSRALLACKANKELKVSVVLPGNVDQWVVKAPVVKPALKVSEA